MTEENNVSGGFIPCGCGCDELMTSKTKKGKPRKFLPYHYFRLPIHQGRKLTSEHKLKVAHKGDKHWNYRGGRGKHAEGYVRVSGKIDGKKDSRILEHRLVWEEYNKACLLSWGQVHHINHIKTDNSPNNLKGVMHYQHPTYHKKDMSSRRCSECNKISKEYYRGSQVWRKHPLDKSKFVCNTCYKKIRKTIGDKKD